MLKANICLQEGKLFEGLAALSWYKEKSSCKIEFALGMGYYKDNQV